MSDGPHRSLPMRRGWKRLAECADNPASAPQEIAGAVVPAVEPDWRADVSADLVRCVRDILGEQQESLFREQKTEQLEALGRMTAGHGMGQSLIEYTIQACLTGKLGEEALEQAARNTLVDRAARGARQVEEHYYRESTGPRALNVRARIEEGIKGAALDALVQRVLSPGSSPVPAYPAKKQGLDDGVRI